MSNRFTQKEAIRIQQKQIKQMSYYLKPEVVQDLIREAFLANSDLDEGLSGYAVFRGNDLTEWVHNNRDKWKGQK